MFKTVKLFINILILVVIFIFSCDSEANTKKIEKSILHIVQNGLQIKRGYGIKPWPKNPIVKLDKERLDLAMAINYASNKYTNVPWELLTAIAFREGSFNINAVSKSSIGERSTFQIAPRTAKYIETLDSECNIETVNGSAICASAWLSYWIDSCGDLRGAMTQYVAGKGCKTRNEHIKRVVNDRLRIMKSITKLSQ